MDDSDQNLDDYLSEFEKLIPFDSETCPKCGIKVSDTVSVTNSPFVEAVITSNEEIFKKIYTILESNNIDFKVYKDLDNTSFEIIRYNYRFLVKIQDIESVTKLLENTQIKNPIREDRV